MAEVTEVKKLQCLPLLKGLVLAGMCPHNYRLSPLILSYCPSECPLCELDEYRVEVLILIRGLERLDKDEFTEDERTDAEEVRQCVI